MSYKLTLSSGKVITGAEVSGTCFAVKYEVQASEFGDGLFSVKIEPEGELEAGSEVPYGGELQGAKLGRVFRLGEEWYFYFEAKSAEELERMKDRADIEYVAMMTGVKL